MLTESHIISRTLSFIGFLSLSIFLILVIRPSKKELKCAFLASLFQTIFHYILDAYAEILDLWHWHIKGLTILNVPIDIETTGVFYTLSFLMIYTLFKNFKYHALIRALYVIIISAIGTLSDYIASKYLGWFTFGNEFRLGHDFLACLFVVTVTVWFYHFCLRGFWINE